MPRAEAQVGNVMGEEVAQSVVQPRNQRRSTGGDQRAELACAKRRRQVVQQHNPRVTGAPQPQRQTQHGGGVGRPQCAAQFVKRLFGKRDDVQAVAEQRSELGSRRWHKQVDARPWKSGAQRANRRFAQEQVAQVGQLNDEQPVHRAMRLHAWRQRLRLVSRARSAPR